MGSCFFMNRFMGLHTIAISGRSYEVVAWMYPTRIRNMNLKLLFN
jgi:hypothetical protein